MVGISWEITLENMDALVIFNMKKIFIICNVHVDFVWQR